MLAINIYNFFRIIRIRSYCTYTKVVISLGSLIRYYRKCPILLGKEVRVV
jgi:hypothetical protein